jgi:hypothetical protein
MLPVAGVLLASASSILCLQSAGALHGVLFGGCIAVVLLTPGLIAGASRGILLPGATVIAIAGGAMVGVVLAQSRGQLNTRLMLSAAAVIPSLAIGAAGLTLLIARIGIHPSAAAWIVIVLLLAWLSWPIWMSPWIADHQSWLPALTSPHPLLSLDAALMRDGIKQWIEAPSLMYGPPGLTSLGQDVFYAPPASVWPGVALHVGVGVPGLALAAWKR